MVTLGPAFYDDVYQLSAPKKEAILQQIIKRIHRHARRFLHRSIHACSDDTLVQPSGRVQRSTVLACL
jgi:hypothetical protein